MALVQPYLIYCMPLWGSQPKIKEFSKLFVIQKKCIRIITNKTDKIGYAFQHTKPLSQNTKILTIYHLFFYMTALEAIKILGFKIPTVLFDKFGIYQNFTVTVSRSKIFLVSNETKKLFI